MSDDEITVLIVLKLLLFLVWWFSGIGVGTAFMSPGIVGSQISPNIFLIIVLAFFCSILLIIALIPGPPDSLQYGSGRDGRVGVDSETIE